MDRHWIGIEVRDNLDQGVAIIHEEKFPSEGCIARESAPRIFRKRSTEQAVTRFSFDHPIGACEHRGRHRIRSVSIVRALSPGVITGAYDDPSAIGTYPSGVAQFGPGFLWTARATLPMMYVIPHLSSKLGQVRGRGLFHVIKDYPRWILWPALRGMLTGKTIEAAADLGGMTAAINLFLSSLADQLGRAMPWRP